MQANSKTAARFYFLASIFVVIAALHLAREFLVPISLAFLLSFVLGPLVTIVQRTRVGRISSVLLVTLMSCGLLAGAVWLFSNQVADIALDVPQYTENLRVRVRSFKGVGTGMLSGLSETAKQLNAEISILSQEGSSEPPTSTATRQIAKKTLAVPGQSALAPLWTRPVEASTDPLDILGSVIAYAAGPLGTTFLVIIFVIFMLVQREDLRNRLIRLIGEGQLTVTTAALDDAGKKISSYLTMQLLVNLGYGAGVALGLWCIGIPHPILWGLLSGTMRFIPYVGAWIGAVPPILLSLAISHGWSQPLSTLGLFVGLELVVSNLIEPWLFGLKTGLAPIAVLIAAVFWTWVWGGIGLLLSTPLTVCLLVIAKHVTELNFIAVLFSDAPALQTHVRLYQRLLASDFEEADDIVYELAKSKSADYCYEEVLLPALALCEQDRQRGSIDEPKASSVFSFLRQLIATCEDFAGSQRNSDIKEDNLDPSAIAPEPKLAPHITIFPAKAEADEVSALLLSHVLTHRGFRTEVVSSTVLAAETTALLRARITDIIVISAMPPSALGHARHLLKKIESSRAPRQGVVIALWNPPGQLEKAKSRLPDGGNIELTSTFKETLTQVERLASIATIESGTQARYA